MGEAKQRNWRKQAFLIEHLNCCFCGGQKRATTIDHVPSIRMFSLRQRPSGLEFPACSSCNHATRHHEQAAALLGRVYPDGVRQDEQDDLRRIIIDTKKYNPGLLEEMIPSPEQRLRFVGFRLLIPSDAAGVLNASGPLLDRSIQVVGAKLGLALYYKTTNRIVPLAGGVAVRWYTNFDRVTGKFPADLYQILGPPKTLQQGSWNVGEQFIYNFALTPNMNMGIYLSIFRKSFAVLSLVSDDVSHFPPFVKNTKLHRPGHF
jgi:hypothetical protein